MHIGPYGYNDIFYDNTLAMANTRLPPHIPQPMSYAFDHGSSDARLRIQVSLHSVDFILIEIKKK